MRLIQVLGPGCPKCDALKKNAEEAARLAGADVLVEKISDLEQIMAFGVLMTPAIAIDGEVKSVGKVLPPEDICRLLT